MSYKDCFAFSFRIPTKIVFGEGSHKEAAREMDGLGMRKALVVMDMTLKDNPMVKSLLAAW